MENRIREFITTSVFEKMQDSGLKIWREPLVSFAAAADPLMNELKKWVAEKHLLPGDLLPEAESVIVYYLPFDEKIPKSNKTGRLSSKQWVDTYVHTNICINETNKKLQTFLDGFGYKCETTPATHNFDPKELISRWSHRHLAYIAGLGTFGINNMLITEKGSAGRFGSCVTDLKLNPGARPANEYCLFKAKGTCGVCIKNCPNGALTADGFDRFKCYEMLLENDEANDIGTLTDVCGKCLSGLPCSNRNPVA